MEIYSIDEAFLSLNGFAHLDLFDYAQSIRQRVKRDTGLPVSIGVAATKTLANHIAKKHVSGGVFCLLNEEDIDPWLAKTDVGDIWGIGHEKSVLLKRNGIENALQLKQCPDQWIKKQYL